MTFGCCLGSAAQAATPGLGGLKEEKHFCSPSYLFMDELTPKQAGSCECNMRLGCCKEDLPHEAHG